MDLISELKRLAEAIRTTGVDKQRLNPLRGLDFSHGCHASALLVDQLCQQLQEEEEADLVAMAHEHCINPFDPRPSD